MPSFKEISDKLSITTLHWSVLETVAFQPLPHDILIHNAMMRHPRPVSSEELERIVRDCCDKGWLQRIDAVALSQIDGCLAQLTVVGDLESLTRIGDIDFTHAGAGVYMTLLDSASPEGKWQLEAPCLQLVNRSAKECKIACYMTQLCPLDVILACSFGELGDELASRPIVSVSEPEVIGPWCSHWWNPKAKGFRVEIVMGERVDRDLPN